MSCFAPRLLRVFVCGCAIGGVAELFAQSPHPALRRSSDATDATILERLPIDSSSSATIPEVAIYAPAYRSVVYRGMYDGIARSCRFTPTGNASVTANVQ
jgi:hypothetical protein